MKLSNKNQKISVILLIAVMLTAIFFNNKNFVNGQTGDAITDLSQQIDQQKKKIEEINKQIEAYNEKISQKHQEGISLKNQLAILDNEIKKNELNIEKTQAEIKKINLEIDELEKQINKAQDDASRQKKYLGEYIRTIYQKDQQSYFEILLLNNTFSSFFDQVEYLQQIQGDLQKALNSLQELKQQLEQKKNELENKKTEADKLMKDLKDKEQDLKEKVADREKLFIQTKKSELEFKSLSRQLELEQRQINAEISSLERKVREELSRREAEEKFKLFGPARFVWPVTGRYITAYFHDPDYPYRYIFEHPAIDIRMPQSSSIKSAEAGYVARAKDAGKGYSYIMIVHNDGFSTVYGHVSKIMVKEDEYVDKGQIIGLTGGKPGTAGAGNLTSGPHLHFEVRLNGLPVNPLEFLP